MAEVVAPKGKLDLAAVAGLHSTLGALRGQDIKLDLTHVTQLGALCLQVLVAACKSARAEGTTFHVTGANERVIFNTEIMGVPLPKLTEALA